MNSLMYITTFECRCAYCIMRHSLSKPIISHKYVIRLRTIHKLNIENTTINSKIKKIILDRITYKRFKKRSI